MTQCTAPSAPRIVGHMAADGYRLAARVWDADEPPARIVLIHGIVSHGGWYERCCRHLAQAGFEVHALDRRGSGLNMSARGDVTDRSVWLQDVVDYLTSLPSSPATILLGVSWGGKLVVALATQRPELVDAIGLICPGIFARQLPGRATCLALQAAALLGLARARVTIPLQQPALFTSSPDWQAYLRHDPFTLRRVTVRFALADRQLTGAVQTVNRVSQPVLLALAGRDQIVDNARTLEFVTRIAPGDRTVLFYADAQHTLEFEANPDPYFEDLARWARWVARASNRRKPATLCRPLLP
jgi:alpha-beta hydrolase superfamily lysophospholipase